MRLPARRFVAAALVLIPHAAYFLLIWLERHGSDRPMPALEAPLSIAIRLLPLQDRAPFDPQDVAQPPIATSRSPQAPPEQEPAAMPPDEEPAKDADDPVAIDWYGEAARLAERFAEQADRPRTLVSRPEGPRPCMRRSELNAESRQLIAEHFPPPADLPVTGAGPATPSVRMGGVRVGIIGLAGGTRPPRIDTGDRKSSFRWIWESTNRGGIGFLTPGWEPPPPYDGLFDDMQAGKTPESSVPDPHDCEESFQ